MSEKFNNKSPDKLNSDSLTIINASLFTSVVIYKFLTILSEGSSYESVTDGIADEYILGTFLVVLLRGTLSKYDHSDKDVFIMPLLGFLYLISFDLTLEMMQGLIRSPELYFMVYYDVLLPMGAFIFGMISGATMDLNTDSLVESDDDWR